VYLKIREGTILRLLSVWRGRKTPLRVPHWNGLEMCHIPSWWVHW